MTSPGTLDLQRRGSVLHVTLNQPATRNALSGRMVEDLRAVAADCAQDRSLRAVVLRGAGGSFCAGGNLGDFRHWLQSPPVPGEADPIAVANRAFGRLLQDWKALPQVVLVAVEGVAIGGGVGLAAIGDLVLAEAGARFGMPETSLGLPPAQILPFVAMRIGETPARRLALTAARIDAAATLACGLVDQVADSGPALEQALRQRLDEVLRCAPGALASTKAILARQAAGQPLDALLDFAAQQFASALRGDEAAEGIQAFADWRRPAWAALEQ